ncbi:MAG TPA: ribose 5-phosphate isomerase B [Candidatus Glassbacteria bacterium]|nr:ribose 5-phosphate isomerase B [Candidatus Glassbacteria bacterium]
MAEKIPIGSDHAGYELKEQVVQYLRELGYEVEDLGTHSSDSVDYPDFAGKVAGLVSRGERRRGILVCGTGIGMSITANKYAGVRAALATSEELARLSRAHNDANVLTLGGRTTDPEMARRIVKTWLETGFEGGRHTRRVGKIAQAESSGAC